MKKTLAILMVVVALFVVGCSDVQDANERQRQATKQLMNEAENQIGMPNIKNFFERKMLRDVLELRDQSDLVTYAYTQNLDGRFVYIGRCIGFGIPYSTQYTNPEVITWTKGSHSHTLPQADPNGLFAATGMSATWLMIINEETGKKQIMYAEPNIIVTQSKLPRRLVAPWSLPANY